MSLINEALRKATRKSGAADPVPSPAFPRSPFPKPPRRFSWVGIPVGFLLLLLLVWAASWQRQENTIPKAQELDVQTPLPVPAAPAPSPTETVSPPSPPVPVEPSERFRLNGTATGVGTPYVLINNRVVQKGEDIDGYILKEVYEKKAVLEKGPERLELRLQ